MKKQVREIIGLSFIFCMFWFFSNYFYNLGLVTTSVSSSTVLSNTSSIFVYLISILFLKEKLNLIKGLFVLVSFAGVIIITVQDSFDPSNDSGHSIMGDIFSLVSAMCYGMYATYLKMKIPKEKEEDFQFTYFLGFVGLINIIVLIPLFPIFNATGLEELELPNGVTLGFLTVNAFLGTFISDYCWARSVVLLGPLITTLGISLTIPLSIVTSMIFDDKSFTLLYFFGSFLILLAFVVISSLNYRDEMLKKR